MYQNTIKIYKTKLMKRSTQQEETNQTELNINNVAARLTSLL
jgi:hypothetical protein